MAMDDKKQEFNWGCLILASPFVALIVFVLVSFFVIFTQDSSKKEYLKKAQPLNPNEPMNPILWVQPTPFQIESKEFKYFQIFTTGGSNQPLQIKVIDSNDYCYFIDESENYIYPLVLDPKTGRQYRRVEVNFINSAKGPHIKYLKVTVKRPLYGFFHASSIDEQRAWLRERKNDSKIELNKTCSKASTASIMAIKYTLDGKLYEYEVDEQTNRQLNQKLKHLFN